MTSFARLPSAVSIFLSLATLLTTLWCAPSAAETIVEKDEWYPTAAERRQARNTDMSETGYVQFSDDQFVEGTVCPSNIAQRDHYYRGCGVDRWCYRHYRSCVENVCPIGTSYDTTAGTCAATPPPPANKNGGCPDQTAKDEGKFKSNPCNASSGSKVESEVDFAGVPGIPSLVRYYNSDMPRNLFGYGWSASLTSKRLYFFTNNTVHAMRDDSKTFAFICANANGACTGDSDSPVHLSKDATGYTLFDNRGRTERYSTLGAIVTETDHAGQTTTYTHNGLGQMTSVRGPFGHTFTLLRQLPALPESISSVFDPAGKEVKFQYTPSTRNPYKVIYPDGTAKMYHFENTSFPHHLTGISYVATNNAITRYSTYTYNVAGKVASSEHAGPVQRSTFTYNGIQTTVTDAANTSEVLTFGQSQGVTRLTNKTTNIDGKTLDRIFDSNNNLVCEKNEEGKVTTHAYNNYNQRLNTTEGLSGTCAVPTNTSATRTTTYTYVSTDLDLPSTINAPSVATGQTKTTTISYNNGTFPNLPTAITQNGYTPTGASVSRSINVTYNGIGQVATIDGPRTDVNDVTTLTYNICTTGGGCGQLSSMTNAMGQTTVFNIYDAAARLTQSTDPNGLVTTYVYSARGRVTQITQTPPTGSVRVTTYTYTAGGDVATVTFPDATKLTYTYNAARLLTKVADLVGNYVSYTYDAKGNRITQKTYSPTNVLVRQIDLAYDLRNNLAQINAAGSITQQIHDALGNITQTNDPKNNPTQNSFDALNRVTQTLNALGGTTSYSYDANDKLKQVIAPNNATTQYSYDDLGNLLSEVSPDRGTTTYTHDAAGNLTGRTDARSIMAAYSYDALNRITGVNYPGTAEDVVYSYDTGAACTMGVGRLCQIVDGSGTTTFAYDAFGNVTQQKKTELGFIYTTSYTFDAGDRVNSITYPDGRVITYTRNTLRQITGVSATVNGAAQTIVSSRTYKADGLLASQTYGNALAETRTYDLQGRLTNQNLGTAGTRLYGYDLNANVTSLQNPSHTGSYTYDALDRLIQDAITSSPSSTVPFTYDPNGNRTSDGTNTNTYAAATNKLTQTGSSVITTDAAGNVTGDGINTYTYNNDGHLSTVNASAYTYNAQRQRTRKVVNSTTTLYHYDLNGNLILETNATSNTQVAYVYADTAPLGQINRNSGTDTVTYLHTDHESTPRLGTNPTRAVVWAWNGKAFGNTASTGTVTVNHRYPGQYYDAESNLLHNHNRYYHPGWGRYLASDPIGLDGGHNTYIYVNDNPLKWVDPEGLKGGGGARPGPRPRPPSPKGPKTPFPQPEVTQNGNRGTLADKISDLLDPPSMPVGCVLRFDPKCPNNPSNGFYCPAGNVPEAWPEGHTKPLTCKKPQIVWSCR